MKGHKKQSGFTLIEMIVSLGVFSVVVTIAVGALLILIASNRQLQEEQSILTNLAFALDSMTREIRTGSHYFCAQANNINSAVSGERIFASTGGNRDVDGIDSPPTFVVADCRNGRTGTNNVQGVAFIEGGESITDTSNTGDRRILYFYDDSTNQLYRKIGNGPAESIVSDGIHIINAEFFVTGSEPLLSGPPTDDHQASVTIFIEAAADDPAVVSDTKRHKMQTTIVQRVLDI